MSHSDGARVPGHRALLAVLLLAALAYSLTQTMVIPALPAFAERYGLSGGATAWLLTGFLLSASVCTPLAGRLGDLYGKGRVLFIVLVVFTAGLIISAVGTSYAIVLVGRVVQGASAALIPLSSAILRDRLPAEKVAPAVGLLGAMIGAGGGGGLLLAGLFVDVLSVSWVFISTAAVAAVLTIAAARFVPLHRTSGNADVDWTGAVLLASGMTALVLAISQGGSWGWTSFGTVALVVLAVLGFTGMVVYELRVRDPLIDVPLLLERAVWSTNVATFAAGFSMLGLFTLVPQLVQLPGPPEVGFGQSATVAGLVMLPSSVLMFVCGPLAGWLDGRVGSRVALALGAVLAGAASVLLAFRHASLFDLAVGTAVMGAGVGVLLAAMTNLTLSSVGPEKTGVATGINTVLRTLGSAVGAQVVAVLLTTGGDGAGDAGRATGRGFTLGFVATAVAAAVALVAVLIPERPRADRLGVRRSR